MTTIKSAAVSAASKINAATRTRGPRGRFAPVAPVAQTDTEAPADTAAQTDTEAPADRPKGRDGRVWGRMRRDR